MALGEYLVACVKLMRVAVAVLQTARQSWRPIICSTNSLPVQKGVGYWHHLLCTRQGWLSVASWLSSMPVGWWVLHETDAGA
jgi:hypothetical protein